MTTLMAGVEARRVPTARLTQNILSARDEGEPVLFVHGNVSSALFWQPTMLALPAGFRPLAVDLRGFGDTDPEPVDATRGVRDWAEDLAALLDALELDRVHLVGWSLGGGVVMQFLLDAPERVASLTLVAPVSPYGFGGTAGLDGRLVDPAGAGTGGGTANAEFVEHLRAGDRGEDSPLSPRNVLLAHYVAPPCVPEPLDAFVESMLSTRLGDDFYPGTSSTVDTWPGVGPGDRGVLNTLAPTHLRLDGLSTVDPKPPVLWIRGTGDVIVSDTSLYDLAHLGALGVVPGWPGPEAYPAQPMVGQTRAVLAAYAAAGGEYREVALEDSGHGPHLDQPAAFRGALLTHLTRPAPAAG
ncbi:MAG TPA: alpha/beta hydrolase [Mycobacteriales bacterium]|nr:alpha/beta hydrolase [Mycobacteriales bacterium]